MVFYTTQQYYKTVSFLWAENMNCYSCEVQSSTLGIVQKSITAALHY